MVSFDLFNNTSAINVKLDGPVIIDNQGKIIF